jgi:hypothetical protein
MAARAADVPAFAILLGQSCFSQEAKAGHIRRFGNIPALIKSHASGSNPIGVIRNSKFVILTLCPMLHALCPSRSTLLCPRD